MYRQCGALAINLKADMNPPPRHKFAPMVRFAVEHPLLTFACGVLLALCIVIAVAGPMLKAPMNDVLLLMLFLGSTGALSVLISYALYKFGLIRWFSSLRWALLAVIVLTVVLIFVNVWITAQLMFIKQHDLILTTLL